jgi:predicted NAD/FAD-binding protein
MLSCSALAFIRFHANHGLLQLKGRPVWETVAGGSVNYVTRMTAAFPGRLKLDTAVLRVERFAGGGRVWDSNGGAAAFDHVVLAVHADQAMRMISDPTPMERELLGAFRYRRNLAVLHTDSSLMPKRRAAWSSWNYIEGGSPGTGSFTYWMNRLQNLPHELPLFVTLNPLRRPQPGTLLHSETYDHPVLDAAAISVQKRLWQLQGARNTWYCGAYFGSGFHEDGLQAGLAVAEQLGGVRRPWTVADESSRIMLGPHVAPATQEANAP